MKAKTRKMIPMNIRPGIHIEFGHHRTSPSNASSRDHRWVNLHRPERCSLSPARQVSVEEWEAGK